MFVSALTVKQMTPNGLTTMYLDKSHDDQIIGIPGCFVTDCCDVSDNPHVCGMAEQDQTRNLVKSLFADLHALKAHNETKECPPRLWNSRTLPNTERLQHEGDVRLALAMLGIVFRVQNGSTSKISYVTRANVRNGQS